MRGGIIGGPRGPRPYVSARIGASVFYSVLLLGLGLFFLLCVYIVGYLIVEGL